MPSTTFYRVSGLAIALLAVGLLVIGSFVPSWGKHKIQETIEQQELLSSPSTTAFRGWVSNLHSSAPEYKYFYLFNITNAAAFLSGVETKPIVSQVGPFVYQVYSEKFNISWSSDSTEISFKTWTYYQFVSELSVGSEEDIVTNINMGLQIIWGSAKSSPTSAYQILSYLNQQSNGYAEKLFVSLSVKQWLWGYQDPILTVLNKLLPSVSPYYPGLGNNQTSIDIANAIDWDTICTGAQGQSAELQQYIMYRGSQSVELWGSAEANVVGGTGGSQFHSGVECEETLRMWNNVMMRVVPLTCASASEVKGIKVLRYEEADSVYENMYTYPPNAAYYQYGPNGLVNLSASVGHMELFLSKPHFLDASEDLQQSVIGLNPQSSKHQTFINVEPVTGATIDAAFRTQVNAYIYPFNFTNGIVWFDKVSPTFMPILWAQQAGSLSADQAAAFISTVYGAEDKLSVAKWSMVGAGVVLGVIGIAMYCKGMMVVKSDARKSSTSGLIAEGGEKEEEVMLMRGSVGNYGTLLIE